MLSRLIAAGLFVLTSCSAVPLGNRGTEFVLCNNNPNNNFSIRIDYEQLVGIYEDYGMRVGACGDIRSGCINFPLVLSAPPILPTGSQPIVRWSVEGYNFTMEWDRARPGHYSIVADGRHSDGTPIGRRVYDYDDRIGLTGYRAEGVPGGWTRCAGRLAFVDLRELRTRLN
jgi:hypothetical protein